jgi:hypothetical protein
MVFQENVSHGERAMSANGQIGGRTHFIRKGLNQFRRLVIG